MNDRKREQHEFLSKHGLNIAPTTSDGIETVINSNLFFGLTRSTFLPFIRNQFVVDAAQDYYYYWIGVISLAYLYNLLV